MTGLNFRCIVGIQQLMTVQTPIPDYAAARTAMVESQLRPLGVTDPAVVAALKKQYEED